MADKQSREGSHIASKEALSVRSEILNRGLDHCKPLTPAQVDTVLDLFKEMKPKKKAGTIELDVDCEDALKGLKAVQREAKEATRSIKDLQQSMNISNRVSSLFNAQRVHLPMSTTAKIGHLVEDENGRVGSVVPSDYTGGVVWMKVRFLDNPFEVETVNYRNYKLLVPEGYDAYGKSD